MKNPGYRIKSINQSSITLNRYSDKTWEQLQTNLSGEDEKYLYFTAQTPGFSPFAITGKTTTTGTKTQPVTVNEIQSKPDTVSTAANTEQTTEQTQSSNTYGKENTKMPGFGIAFGIICLLCVFLYTRRKKSDL